MAAISFDDRRDAAPGAAGQRFDGLAVKANSCRTSGIARAEAR
jgi:hypothetical protein